MKKHLVVNILQIIFIWHRIINTYMHSAVDLCKYLNIKTRPLEMLSCAVDVLQFRIMRRIYQIGINLLGFDIAMKL